MIHRWYRSLRGTNVQEIQTHKPGSWIHVEHPSEEELDALAAAHQLDRSVLHDALDPFEMPRYETDHATLYIFIRYPVCDGEAYSTIPLLVILHEECVITICHRSIAEFPEKFIQKESIITTQKTKLVLQIIGWTNYLYTMHRRAITRHILGLRRQMTLEKITNQDIMHFVTLEEALQEFLGALMPTSMLLERLLSHKQLPVFEMDVALIEDIQLSTKQLIDLCASGVKSLVAVRESYSTIMTNSLNRIIKALTSLTVILMVPNLLFSFYGMNIPLPWSGATGMAHMILGVVFGGTAVALIFLFRIGWL
jgi:magnesium transporter